MDLILTVFCALTLLVLAFGKCGSTSKEEEILDTLLLVARNVLQFSRLAAVMRQYVIHPVSYWFISDALRCNSDLGKASSHDRNLLTSTRDDLGIV